MELHVTVKMYQGIIEDVSVFTNPEAAQATLDTWKAENDLADEENLEGTSIEGSTIYETPLMHRGNYTLTHRGERVLWVLLEDDAQAMAEKKIGRRLTEEELRKVRKGLESGMQYRVELETAIEMVTEP